jgi:hypothetical protein
VTLIFKALQLVVPIATSAAAVMLTDEQLKHAQSEFKLMTTVVGKLPELEIKNEIDGVASGSTNQLSPAQGQALRGIRQVLFKQDPMRSFGDMRRVQAPSGDFLWVCTDHYAEYDPGLPLIPEPEPVQQSAEGEPSPRRHGLDHS